MTSVRYIKREIYLDFHILCWGVINMGVNIFSFIFNTHKNPASVEHEAVSRQGSTKQGSAKQGSAKGEYRIGNKRVLVRLDRQPSRLTKLRSSAKRHFTKLKNEFSQLKGLTRNHIKRGKSPISHVRSRGEKRFNEFCQESLPPGSCVPKMTWRHLVRQ